MITLRSSMSCQIGLRKLKGKQNIAAGREIEAVDFLSAADPGANSTAREALIGLRVESLEHGDVFLMRVVSRALAEEPSSEDWQALAEAATRAGRVHDAETAQRVATVTVGD